MNMQTPGTWTCRLVESYSCGDIQHARGYLIESDKAPPRLQYSGGTDVAFVALAGTIESNMADNVALMCAAGTAASAAADAGYDGIKAVKQLPRALEVLQEARQEFYQCWHSRMSKDNFEGQEIIMAIDTVLAAAKGKP